MGKTLEQVQDVLEEFINDVGHVRNKDKEVGIGKSEIAWLANKAAWLSSEMTRFLYWYESMEYTWGEESEETK